MLIPSTRPVEISIHAPAKGATPAQPETDANGFIFQSTLPRRERRMQKKIKDIMQRDFNPRSREGSDTRNSSIQYSPDISIHAPAKGATSSRRSGHAHGRFQSTLPRRERPGQAAGTKKALLFQSTLPRRERRIRRFVDHAVVYISIHAPAKGATCRPETRGAR